MAFHADLSKDLDNEFILIDDERGALNAHELLTIKGFSNKHPSFHRSNPQVIG